MGESRFARWYSPGLFASFTSFLLVLSLVPKWFTLHVAGLLVVFSLLAARRQDWTTPAMKTCLGLMSLWMVPVILAFCAQHLLGYSTAPDIGELVKLLLRVYGVALGLIFFLDRGWLSLMTLALLVLAALGFHAGVGMVEWHGHWGFSVPDLSADRLMGLAKNSNPYGLFMALMLVMCVGLLKLAPRNLLLWFLLCISALALLGSGSRGAFLAALLGLLVLFPPRNMLRLGLGLAVIAALVLWYATTRPPDWIAQSNQLRLDALAISLRAIIDSPLIGWGVGSFRLLPYHSGVTEPHSMWAEMAVGSGLIALLGLCVAVWFIIARLRRSSHVAAPVTLALFVTFLVSGATDGSVLVSTHWRGAWVILFALACHVIASDQGSSHRRLPPLRGRAGP